MPSHTRQEYKKGMTSLKYNTRVCVDLHFFTREYQTECIIESKVPVSLCCHCTININEILPVFGIVAFLWGVHTGGVTFSYLYFAQDSVRKKRLCEDGNVVLERNCINNRGNFCLRNTKLVHIHLENCLFLTGKDTI